ERKKPMLYSLRLLTPPAAEPSRNIVPSKVIAMDMKDIHPDVDPQETQEWLEALDSVLEREGPDRAHFLLERLVEKARRSGAYIPFNATTAYINTIPPSREEHSPGDAALEHRLRSLVRWNAMAMVVRANKESSELGGHIASFASAATL